MSELPPHTRLNVSRRSLDRAGDTLRERARSGTLLWSPAEQEAEALLERYRHEFEVPLTKVVMDLRSMMATSGEPVLVSQRLKRRPRIIAKLARHPAMQVSRMQDIAGCRAVLASLEGVDRVRRRIEQAGWSIAHEDDYGADPKAAGYRAVHLGVIRDATPVEIQLRTTWQQAWAAAVERLDLRYGLALKDGRGPEPLGRFMEQVAYARDLQGRGIALAPGLQDELARLAMEAEQWLSNRRSTR